MKIPQTMLTDLQTLAAELHVDLTKPSLYQQWQNTKIARIEKQTVTGFLSLISTALAIYFLYAYNNQYYNRFQRIKTHCADNNGTTPDTALKLCAKSYKPQHEQWQEVILECCALTFFENATDPCEDTLNEKTDILCNTDDTNGVLFTVFLLSTIVLWAYTLCCAQGRQNDRYTNIPDINDPQANLDADKTQRLETILKDISDINIAGSSSHKNPAQIQLEKLTSLVNGVTLTPNVNNRISAQTIKEIYWTLETFVKLSSGVKKIVSSQYNAQGGILNQDPEAGAGVGANMSYQKK